MNRKPIIIVPGQINSVFFEIFFKSLKIKDFISPIVLICDFRIFKKNAKKFKFKNKFKLINSINEISRLKNKTVNVFNVNLKKKKKDNLGLKYEKDYTIDCFETAFNILEKKISLKFLNGPINKKKILNKKFIGITEYISEFFNQKKTGMLIYNNNLSVSPLTTHLPIKLIAKQITKKQVYNRIKLINNFFIKNFKIKPKIGVTGLNPHCESILPINEDETIISPAIELAKKNGIKVNGPHSADTIFLKQNRVKFDVILGMYHDQVLTPIKTLYEYDAINVTMGLPFLRVSPDHGPNEKMINKNKSNPISLQKCLEFLDKN